MLLLLLSLIFLLQGASFLAALALLNPDVLERRLLVLHGLSEWRSLHVCKSRVLSLGHLYHVIGIFDQVDCSLILLTKSSSYLVSPLLIVTAIISCCLQLWGAVLVSFSLAEISS